MYAKQDNLILSTHISEERPLKTEDSPRKYPSESLPRGGSALYGVIHRLSLSYTHDIPILISRRDCSVSPFFQGTTASAVVPYTIQNVFLQRGPDLQPALIFFRKKETQGRKKSKVWPCLPVRPARRSSYAGGKKSPTRPDLGFFLTQYLRKTCYNFNRNCSKKSPSAPPPSCAA